MGLAKTFRLFQGGRWVRDRAIEIRAETGKPRAAQVRGGIRSAGSTLSEFGYAVYEDVDRQAKTRTLREAAAEFRRIAEAGEDAQVSIIAARMLEQRADRIEAGEADHSAIRWDAPVSAEGLRTA